MEDERDLPGAWPADSGLHWRNRTGDVDRPRGIVVLGHNWGDRIGYDEMGGDKQRTRVEEMLNGARGALTSKWATFGRTGLMLDRLAERADVDLTRAFFTNAFVGFKVDGPIGDVGVAPRSPLHRACIDLFARTVRLLKPRAVVSLGKAAAVFLAHATTHPEVSRWAPWQGFRSVDKLGPVAHSVSVRGAEADPFTAVAFTHPSMPNFRKRSYNGVVGEDALIKMLRSIPPRP